MYPDNRGIIDYFAIVYVGKPHIGQPIGVIHHAVAAGLFRVDQVHAELGAIVAGLAPGRTRADEITIADQTGIGVLDAAVANYVATRIATSPGGRWLDA